MSALDDLIARDTGQAKSSGSALDALITSDLGSRGSTGTRISLDNMAPDAGAGRGFINPSPPPEPVGGLSAFGGGIGHGVGTTMLGVQQLLGRGLAAAGVDQAGKWLTNDADQGLKKLDAEYSPLSDAHPIIAGAGNIGGQIGATLLPAGAISKMAPAYSALGLGGRVALGSAQGAAGAAMMPVQSDNPDSSYWASKAGQVGIGGAMGGAFPILTAAASAMGRGAMNLIQPVVQPQRFVGQGMANAMSPQEASLAAANIRSAPEFVPGSMPTTAQAAPSPFMVQTEKAASNLPGIKTGMIQRGIDNNAARWDALNGVAGTDADLVAAQSARSQATSPLYTAANQATAPIDNSLVSIVQRPALQQAMQTADTLAKNEGVQIEWPTPQNPIMSGHALDYTNRALGDLIDTAKRAGNTQQSRALTGAQAQLKTWGENNIPELGQAAKTYAQLSVPVNTMEVGQQMSGALVDKALNAGNSPEIQLAAYRTALRQAMKGADYGIEPGAESVLRGIQSDLQRSSISNSIRSPGSDSIYNLSANGWLAKNLYGPSFEGATGLGKTLAAIGTLATGRPIAAAGIYAGGGKIGQMVGGRLQDRMSGLLLNPDTMLPFLDARGAAMQQSIQNPLMQGLLNYGRPAITGAGLGLLGDAVHP